MEDKKLLEMENELKQKDRTIWTCMWVIMTLSILGLTAGVLATAFLVPEGIWQMVTVLGLCVLFLIPCFYALKLEISVGSYQCKKCGKKIVPAYKEALNAMHRGTTRYLKCPECGRRTWCKKVLK